MSKGIRKGFMLVTIIVLAFALAACGGSNSNGGGSTPANNEGAAGGSNGNTDGNTASGGEEVTGNISIDGSSTVYPISQAVAEEFMKVYDVNVEVSASGTGGGFKKFANNELDITGASRPQKEEERQAAADNGIEGVELKVANDGITIVINKDNTWAEDMTMDELKKLWEPAAEGVVTKWSDIRDGWPDQPINLYGPGTDSGTFDFFTGEIVGEEGASRGDYQPSEDDHVIVQGVAGDVNAMGYFGYAYYVENQDTLKAVKINGIGPSAETIEDGSYAPLSRPIFIYVKKSELERPDIQKYLEFQFTEGVKLIPEVGYIPLADEAYQANLEAIGL